MKAVRIGSIAFPRFFVASGAGGFFGEGYPFHRLPPWRFVKGWWEREDVVFTAKTTTLKPRAGNMPLKADGITPQELFPRCIIAKPLSGHVLNAVGLSGPGAEFLFEQGLWQMRTRPFCLSFMAVAPSRSERLEEMHRFVELARHYLPRFQAKVALQVTFGCPNTEHELAELWMEIADMLDVASALHIPLIPNFSPAAPPEILIETAQHPYYAALCLGNTFPWGNPLIDWRRIFGQESSPLVDRGFSAGGLSGPACLVPALVKLSAVRKKIPQPIIVGNGIQSPLAARAAYATGADAILVGVAGIVRPWRLNSIINAALV